MAGRHAAVVPRSRSRSPQAVARTDPGEMISQVRGVSGISVASIEMHTHDRCRVLKHRISSVPQRTCVQERTTKRVMVSSAPCGIMLHVVVIHASSIRVLACVNMEWLHSVRTVIRELRRGFLDGDFHVGCLGPEVLHDGQAKLRLQRVLCMRFGRPRRGASVVVPNATIFAICHWEKQDVLPRPFASLLSFFVLQRVRLRHV